MSEATKEVFKEKLEGEIKDLKAKVFDVLRDADDLRVKMQGIEQAKKILLAQLRAKEDDLSKHVAMQ